MPEFRELLSLEFWRERTIVLFYGLAAVVLFVIFTIGTFPYDQALSGALLPMGLKVSYNSEHPAFPIGAVLEDVTVVNLQRPSPPLVQSDALKLTPGIQTLIGRPAIGIRADMYGGRVWIKIRRHGDLTGLKMDLTNVNMARYPTASLLGLPLTGIVSGQADLETTGPSIDARKGAFALEGQNVDFVLLRGLPSFRFATFKANCTIEGRTLRVNSLEGRGPDMTVSGSGILHLAPTMAQTMIQMTLHISPTIAGRARLGILFNFLPHPPDNRPYIFHGPLLMPQVS
jgi:type II secretion system protein N